MSKRRIKAICVYCGSRIGISNEYSYNAKLLGQKIANNNFEVFVAGRTRSSLDNVVNTILNDGNKATPIVVDATDENQIKNMIKEIGSGLDFAVYNVGNSRPGKIVEILKKSKCMNPVIYFDELDKVG